MAVLQQKTSKQNQHREKAQGWHPEETGQAPKGPLPANSGRTPRLLLAGSCDHVEVSLAQEVARDAAAGRLPGLGVRRLGACAQREPRSDGPCVGTAMSSWRHQLGAVGTPLKSKSPRTAPEDSSPVPAGLTFTAHFPPCASFCPLSPTETCPQSSPCKAHHCSGDECQPP